MVKSSRGHQVQCAKQRRHQASGCSYGPVVNSSEVQYHMMPLPGGASSSSTTPKTAPASASTVPTTKPIVKDNDLKGQKGKGNGKGKGKIVVPEDCEIKFGETNKPICMKFNIGTCGGNVRPGKRCQYGFHVCWKKSCHKAHSAVECTS